MVAILFDVVSIFVFRFRSRAALELKLVALQHQLAVLRECIGAHRNKQAVVHGGRGPLTAAATSVRCVYLKGRPSRVSPKRFFAGTVGGIISNQPTIVNKIFYSRSDRAVLYALTQHGRSIFSFSRANWIAFSEGSPNILIGARFVFSNDHFAAQFPPIRFLSKDTVAPACRGRTVWQKG